MNKELNNLHYIIWLIKREVMMNTNNSIERIDNILKEYYESEYVMYYNDNEFDKR